MNFSLRYLVGVVAILLACQPVHLFAQADDQSESNALTEAQRISRITGRPMFVVAGQST